MYSYQSLDQRQQDRSPLLGRTIVDDGSDDDQDGYEARRSLRTTSLALGTAILLGLVAVAALSGNRGGGLGRQNTFGYPNQLLAQEEQATIRYSGLQNEELTARFKMFMHDFEKQYPSDEEMEVRFEIFKDNLYRIDQRQLSSPTTTYGITYFTDWTEEEYQSKLTNGNITPEAKLYAISKSETFDTVTTQCQACTRFPEIAEYSPDTLPDSWDWRDYGAVTSVKNQAECGSCWSFSTTGDLEGGWFLAGNDLISLSEQQLCVCDTTYNQGCNGGWPALAMVYISDNGGIVPEKILPYRKVNMYAGHKDPVCPDVIKTGNYGADLTSVTSVISSPLDEDKMRWWLVTSGPLSVALDATGMDFYSSGVDLGNNCTPDNINHAVLLVGYGEEDGVPYWLIKNSWAIWWGERGYYKLIRGVNACGITEDVAHSIVGSATV